MSRLLLFIILFFSKPVLSQQLHIVVSVPYLKDVLQNITCDSKQYQINSLIPTGLDPHTFILTPQDRFAIKKADLMIQIGAGLEPWLDKVKTDSLQNHIILTQIIKQQKKQISSQRDSKLPEQLATDPHIWQSPELTQRAAYSLAEILSQLNPSSRRIIEVCTKNYIDKIHLVVGKLQSQILVLPKNERILATNHDSFGYFAQAFDFKIYSILGLSDEEQPTFVQLKNLITLLQNQHIKAVFLESTGDHKNITMVAKNSKVKIGGKLYADSLGEVGSGAETTLGMWESNMLTIIKALQ